MTMSVERKAVPNIPPPLVRRDTANCLPASLTITASKSDVDRMQKIVCRLSPRRPALARYRLSHKWSPWSSFRTVARQVPQVCSLPHRASSNDSKRRVQVELIVHNDVSREPSGEISHGKIMGDARGAGTTQYEMSQMGEWCALAGRPGLLQGGHGTREIDEVFAR